MIFEWYRLAMWRNVWVNEGEQRKERKRERKGGKEEKRRHKKYVRRKKRDLWNKRNEAQIKKNIRTSPNAKAKCINAL
jgi:hypothetical protein